MRVLEKLRHVVCMSLSFVLLLGMVALPVQAAGSNVETALNEFTVTISLAEKEKYAGVEMSVVLSDGLVYVSHEMDPGFTGLYQYNGTRHLIGGMTTEGKNVFSGKLEVCVLKLRYTGNSSETISITPAVTRYDSAGKPVSTGKKVQTVAISHPGSKSTQGGGGTAAGVASGDGKIIIVDAKNPNIDVSIDADDSAGSVRFSDVKGHWAESYILSLAAQHYVSGVGNGQFSPNAALTRAQFVQMFYNAFGNGVQSAGPPVFKDTRPGEWYSNAIAWAGNNGIVSGISDTAFGPNDPIKRQDITVIVTRLAAAFKVGLKAEQEKKAFADDARISGYAKDAVYRLQASAIIAGKGNNKFDPQGTATRAEAAKMLYMILEQAGKIDPAYAIPKG